MVCAYHEEAMNRLVGSNTFWTVILILISIFAASLSYVAYGSASKDSVNGLEQRLNDTRQQMRDSFERVDNKLHIFS